MGNPVAALEEYKILQKLDPEQASKLFNLIYPWGGGNRKGQKD